MINICLKYLIHIKSYEFIIAQPNHSTSSHIKSNHYIIQKNYRHNTKIRKESSLLLTKYQLKFPLSIVYADRFSPLPSKGKKIQILKYIQFPLKN